MTKASDCRRLDPVTGEVIEIIPAREPRPMRAEREARRKAKRRPISPVNGRKQSPPFAEL
jgi:hypothetical protein